MRNYVKKRYEDQSFKESIIWMGVGAIAVCIFMFGLPPFLLFLASIVQSIWHAFFGDLFAQIEKFSFHY